MRHVLWIGGAGASGKTEVASRIVRRYGLRWYRADSRTWAHRDRAIREGSAAAIRWEALTPEERLKASPSEMLEMSLHQLRGPMVVDDLQALPRSPLVVAEGTSLPAHAVTDRSRAVWLIPTPEFQEARMQDRGLSHGTRTLFRLLAETIEGEAREHGVRALVVDGSLGIDEMVAEVERLFEDALAEGPRAATMEERRRLLREANEAVAGQVRGYYARPWADGDPDALVRAFVCECGDRSCDETVEARVGLAASAPVLAAGHGECGLRSDQLDPVLVLEVDDRELTSTL